MAKGQPTEIDREIGRRVKEYRDQRGMTQIALGQVLGVSQQQIVKYESGRSRLSVVGLVRMAAALEVNLSSLIQTVAPMILASGFSDKPQESYGPLLGPALREQLRSAGERIDDVNDLGALVRVAEAFGRKKLAR